jgi:hypothetical protein
MTKRTDISKILVLGSGPIVIGHSAEFGYFGTQACKALAQILAERALKGRAFRRAVGFHGDLRL